MGIAVKQKQYGRNILIVIFAVLTALAFLPPASVPDLWNTGDGSLLSAFANFVTKFRMATHDFGLTGVVFTGFLFVFYRKTLFIKRETVGPRVRISALVFSFLLSMCMLLGDSFKAFGNWSFLFANKFQAVFCLLLLIGYMSFFYALVELGLTYADRVMLRVNKVPSTKGLAAFLVDRRPFLIPFAALLIAWLPYWLIYFPGNVSYDTFVQLNNYFGIYEWSNHHPVFGSMLFGGLMQFGRAISGDNLGVFFIILFQNLITAFSCAYATMVMKRWAVPRALRVGVLLYWMLNPLIIFWIPNAAKDIPALAVLFLFCVLFLEIIRRAKHGQPYVKLIVIAVAVGIVSALIRHSYTAAGSLILLVFLKQPIKRRIMCVLAGVICLVGTSLAGSALSSAVDAAPGSIAESLSIPFQQTARYVRDYGDEVTPEEHAAIDAVLAYDALAVNYRADLSDYVKMTYRENPDALSEYFKTWFKMFLKHPGTYVQATLANSYSYYCPNGEICDFFQIVNYSTISGGPNTGFFDIGYTFNSKAADAIRPGLYSMLLAAKNIPGVNFFFHTGNYTWFVIFLALILFRKKKFSFLVGFCPALLTLLTCIASPVNGDFRYFLPMMVMAPLLLAWTVYGAYIEPTEELR